MKLNVFDADIGINASSFISNGYMNYLYSFDSPIKKTLSKNIKLFEPEILNDINSINSDNDISEEDKKNFLIQLDNIKNKLNGSIDEWLACFDKIIIEVNNITLLENIDKIIADIKIPIVLNLKLIPEDYLIDNIERIDKILKENNFKVSYLIKQCLNEYDAHYEDNSYSMEDVLLVLTSVRNLTSVIKEFNLSPFEQVMYAYDIVKDRTYIASNENDSYLESRDMAKILKSDKIVCLGFAALFNSLLDKLNIDNNIVFLEGVRSNQGHARNLVVIKDPKYNLNNIMYFDATWDSKKQENNIIDENRYENFARERTYFLIKDDKKLIEESSLPFFLRKDKDYSFLNKEILSNLFKIKRVFKRIDWKKYFSNIEISDSNLMKVKALMNDDIRYFSIFSNDFEFCEFMYKECCKMLNKELKEDIFLRSLYTVRRVENYLNPEKYSLNTDEIINTYFERYMPNQTDEDKLLCKIFGLDNNLKQKIKKIEESDLKESRDKLVTILKNLNTNIQTINLDENVTINEVIKIKKK